MEPTLKTADSPPPEGRRVDPDPALGRQACLFCVEGLPCSLIHFLPILAYLVVSSTGAHAFMHMSYREPFGEKHIDACSAHPTGGRPASAGVARLEQRDAGLPTLILYIIITHNNII